MTFDISALTARESFWDTVGVWLAILVALGVIMESVVDFKSLAKLTTLDRREELKEKIAKLGLLILIVALVGEVIAAVKSHDVGEEIIHGLNTEILQGQDREAKLVELTNKLGQSNRSLSSELAEQDSLLRSLQNRSAAFESLAKAQKARDDAALDLLKSEEKKLEIAQKDANASSIKAEKAAAIADTTASNMEKTLHAEEEMRQKMHNLITPRSLTEEQLVNISRVLKRHIGTSIDILQIGENPEIEGLRSQIDKALLAAGWNTVSATAVGSGSFVGVAVAVVEGAHESDISAANDLRAVLNRNEINTIDKGIQKRGYWPNAYMSAEGTTANKAPIRLYIGSKP
ncbi:hypothetical protein [Burkholderia sp. BCC1644]|uniref:hypothetical protein n=1 Tax=Burkholderia sp. BCC1644 TaxID=2676293 RepID=UPI0015908EFC|nr:hypothetical protein [Burkholderia sp. BCC1644]